MLTKTDKSVEFQTNFISGSIPCFLRMINMMEVEQRGSRITTIFLRPTALGIGLSMTVRLETGIIFKT